MSERILQPPTYYLIFIALIVLTILTVGVSFLPIGDWHIAVGLVFGACKALLVILFFMHVLYSSRLTWIVAAAGLFWLAIMLGLTLTDYLSRTLASYG
jgi:cytochrome c oxidase subunit 4